MSKINKEEFLKYIDKVSSYFDWIDALYKLNVDIINADCLIDGVINLLEVIFDTDLISAWIYDYNFGNVEDGDFMELIDSKTMKTTVIHTNEELYDYLVGEYE